MITVADIMRQWGQGRVAALKQSHRQAGQRTTGRTERMFEEEINIQDGVIKLKIFGAPWIEYLERGRGKSSGAKGTGETLYEKMKQWVRDKGIVSHLEKEYQKNSVAYLITRKIHEEGTLLHRTGRAFTGESNVVSRVFSEEVIQGLLKKISDNYEIFITSEILKQWQQE